MGRPPSYQWAGVITWKLRSFELLKHPLFCLMFLCPFETKNLLFRIMDPINCKPLQKQSIFKTRPVISNNVAV